ncbi:threonine-phosphate decarboxylase CobD [Rhizobium sp. SL42]|uniref:threonine-phosphate decarboxylase CobD n=1 Tax=Rhizobium sp. SL42 TaxID=2806346 RepID=UPI001F00826E|nr:threonine-phosphate decarboxylase CobD [Rhizobium sp. SL42]UJW73876.1 threonine-phosphate decarboxylase [Rhizobium sp. SL42]
MSGPIQHGGGLAAAAAIYGGQPEDWLDLSTGINPCPPPLPATPDRAWHRLPDRELELAARAAARVFYRSGERLPLAVPGTQSAIQLLPRLVEPSRRVAIFSPTYGEYRRAFELAGFVVDAVTSPEEIDARHGMVVVVNPNNPDGRVFAPDQFSPLIERLRGAGALLVVDEAFGESCPETSMAGTAEKHVIVFRSFGKFFGMAGIRLGFVIADEAITAQMAEWLGPWAVAGPALSIATELFSTDRQVIMDGIAERRAGLDRVLAAHELKSRGTVGLFALVEDDRAPDLHTHLCRHHILTRKFDYAPTWLRFGLAPDRAGDQRLCDALDLWRVNRR